MMHVWHHDVVQHGKGGQNFGLVLSVWDWLFRTVYWPEDRDHPRRLGFEDMQRYPRGLVGRFLYPLSLRLAQLIGPLARPPSTLV